MVSQKCAVFIGPPCIYLNAVENLSLSFQYNCSEIILDGDVHIGINRTSRNMIESIFHSTRCYTWQPAQKWLGRKIDIF